MMISPATETAQDPTPRRCAWCHGSMAGRRPQARTCGDRCRQALSRDLARRDAMAAGAGAGHRGGDPEHVFRVSSSRRGETQAWVSSSSSAPAAWWVCGCSRIVPIRTAWCPTCAGSRPALRLMDVM
jgi:hypothetical protein